VPIQQCWERLTRKNYQPYRHNGAAKFKSAASTGNGAEDAARIARRGMAGNSRPFPKKGKGSMSKIRHYSRCGKREPRMKCPRPRTITAQEALALLESAVSYCQSAGLAVQAANGNNGTLGLFVPNAEYILADNGTHAVFRLSARKPAATTE
jgi:hypothetical protein